MHVDPCIFLTCSTFHKLDLSPHHINSLSSHQKICNSNSQQNDIYSAAFIQMLFNCNAKKMFFNLIIIYYFHHFVSNPLKSGVHNKFTSKCLRNCLQMPTVDNKKQWDLRSSQHRLWSMMTAVQQVGISEAHAASTCSTSAPKMETVHPPEMSVLISQNTWCPVSLQHATLCQILFKFSVLMFSSIWQWQAPSHSGEHATLGRQPYTKKSHVCLQRDFLYEQPAPVFHN
jgi:hypothetical protein